MFKTRNSSGFTVAEVAALLGVTALIGSFLVPSLSSVGNAETVNSTITVSESSVVSAEPETLPVEAILVNVTNTATGETVSRTVNDPDATSTTIAGLDPQANYTVEVAKKSQAGMSAKATAKVDYVKVAEETKQGTRPVEVNDTSKPIMVDDTSRPIMGQVDRGSYKTRQVWVDTSYWVDTSGYQNQAVYGWTTCSRNESYLGTCSGTTVTYSNVCSSVYSHYACFNAACTSGAPRYTTVCSSQPSYSSYSYSCTKSRTVSYSCYKQTGTQRVWVSSGYTQSRGHYADETYWAADMKTEVVGYEKKVAGYQKKTITETFNYQVDIKQAVTTAKEVKAPARQLVIEVNGNPTRSWRWATGTVTAVGAGVAGYSKGDTVYFRMGTVFTFDGKKYIRVPVHYFTVRK